MRAASFLLTSILVATSAVAQSQGDTSPATPAAAEPAALAPDAQGDKNNQRIQRIRVEDSGSRVDELRVGGETKNITVQPKVGNMPSYEVQPQNIEGADGTNGRRVWRALQF
ncbi:MAG: hypothetical protein ACI4QS_07225 [Comamonas sp.]